MIWFILWSKILYKYTDLDIVHLGGDPSLSWSETVGLKDELNVSFSCCVLFIEVTDFFLLNVLLAHVWWGHSITFECAGSDDKFLS